MTWCATIGHALPRALARQRVGQAAQAQDHVGPALAARRTVVELAEHAAQLGLVRKALLDARAREPVERPELFLAQTLVDVDRHRPAGGAQRDRGRLLRSHVRRAQHRVDRVEMPRAPCSERRRLALTELRERHVAVAHADVDHGRSLGEGALAGDVSGALRVPDQERAHSASRPPPGGRTQTRVTCPALRPSAPGARRACSRRAWSGRATCTRTRSCRPWRSRTRYGSRNPARGRRRTASRP